MTAARLLAASTPVTRLRYWAAPLAAALLCCALPVRAGLFDDDEARAKIEQLRSQVDVIQKSAVARLSALETAVQDKRALIDLATSIEAGDCVVEAHDARLVINHDAIAVVEGSELDFISEGFKQIFTVRNPNVKATCGCGESFTV